MRQICEVLGFNKSTFYYQPRIDASEAVLRSEIGSRVYEYDISGIPKQDHPFLHVRRFCMSCGELL